MKKLRVLQGGYPRRMDYLLNLQDELLTVTNSMFGKLGQDLVLSGCDVVNNNNGTVNISPGIVFVGGEVLRFDGASNIANNSTKAFIKDVPANTGATVFGDGLSKQVYTEVKAIIGGKTSIVQIKVSTELYTLATYIRDVAAGYAVKGEIKEVYDFDGTFLDNFDANGQGVTARYLDWALDNGNVIGAGSVGRVIVGAGRFTDPVTGVETNYQSGETGGEKMHKLTVSEMPNHTHPFNSGDQQGQSDNANDRNVMIPGNNARTTSSAGGDQAHNNMQPFGVAYRIVKFR